MKQKPMKPIKEKPQMEPEKTPVLQGNEKRSAVKAVVFALLLFLAMTVQTGRMSMVLCALAFISLIGKRPIARFRARLCLPVVGLLAFMVLEGVAAIYSPFDTTAVSEYYRFLAAASLAVMLLARYDREDVPGLLWGFAAVSAVIGLVSVDAAVPGPLFSAFNGLSHLLGADFTTILETESLTRINGIYNDANVSGCILGVGTLVSLHLSGQQTEKRWGKLVGCLLLGVNAQAFFLSMSRGAMLFFAAACLLWLLTAGKGQRLSLFFRMAASAVAVVALSIPAIGGIRAGNFLPTVLTLVSGIVIFVLTGAAERCLLPLCARHGRMAAGAVIAVGVVCAAYLAAAFTVTGPGHISGQYERFERTVSLQQGSYTLSGDWDAEVASIQVLWRDRTGALMNQWEVLYDGATDGVSFDVPADGTVMVALRGPEGTEIRSLTLSNGVSLKLNYPLLPTFVTERLQDSLSGSFSTWARLQYMKDAVTIFRQSPIIGHGLGATENLYRSVQPFAYESKYVHCQVLQVLCETGILGLVAFLALMLGVGYLCISALRRREEASLAPMLLAAWVLMNGHSLMEINFSIRAFQCFAYALAVLPVLLWARPKKEARTAVGAVLTAAFGLYLAVFGGLLESHRAVEQQEYSTSSIYSYLDMLESCVNRDVFDRWSYELSYVANAVDLDSTKYTATMEKYVKSMRASGTYENCSGLARYYYLPKAQWDELFACSREGVRQVRSSPDGWNLQMDFYRTEVLPAMGADDLDAFLDGVFTLADELDAMNGEEGRLETVAFSEENQAFVDLCRQVRAQGLSGQDGYALLAVD